VTAAVAAAALVLVCVWSVTSGVRAGGRRALLRRMRADSAAQPEQQGAAGFVQRLPTPPEAIARALHDADVHADPRVLTAGWAAGTVVLPTVGLVRGGPGLAVAAAVALVAGPLLLLRLLRGRRAARVEATLPLALETMARTLRTGGSLRQAVGEAAATAPPPLQDDLAAVAGAVAHGAPLTFALDGWVDVCPLPGVRLAAAALSLGAETGGAQARAIDGVAATIRERLGAAAEVRAQATQARVSAGVIALSPIAFGALASSTDHRTAAFLFRTPVGLALLVAGVGLDALGALWMARLTAVPT
jgi:tight adherence protein B